MLNTLKPIVAEYCEQLENLYAQINGNRKQIALALPSISKKNFGMEKVNRHGFSLICINIYQRTIFFEKKPQLKKCQCLLRQSHQD
jgi:hypothetical protein